MPNDRCPVCGQLVVFPSTRDGLKGRGVGAERDNAFEDAAKKILENKGKCVTDAACRALAEEIRAMKGAK